MTKANNDNQYSPERIADRMAIQDAMYRWCRSVDRLDYEGMRAAFHPDGTDNHGIFSGGVDNLVEWVRERHKEDPVYAARRGASWGWNPNDFFSPPGGTATALFIRLTGRVPATCLVQGRA